MENVSYGSIYSHYYTANGYTAKPAQLLFYFLFPSFDMMTTIATATDRFSEKHILTNKCVFR